jgi:diguanylate cyclase (GGDEF)-like protein
VNAELIFIYVTGIIATLLGVGALVVAVRAARAPQAEPDGEAPAGRGDDKYGAEAAGAERLAGTAYGSAVRILWWVSIAAVLIGVGLSDAFDASQPGIYLLGAVAVALVVVLHDLMPHRMRGGVVGGIEVLAALGLTTTLLALTGYGASPFVYGFNLVSVAVALALGGAAGLGVAAMSTLAFLGVLWIDPARSTYGADELLRFGLTVASIWLLAYLAGVFASGERRVRASVLQLSRTDPLTGLFNRGQLFPTLEQEVLRTRRSERGFCLLMIDLDGLKAVNDSYGHHRGDDVLSQLGTVIRRSIRAVDTAYRQGGDEFLVLLPETDFAGAFVVAEKIRSGAEELGNAGGGELLTSVSIGLVSCPEDGTSAEELMIAADRAMYQAKSLGKNQVSGNPRPRRLAYVADEEPVTEHPAPEREPDLEPGEPAAEAIAVEPAAVPVAAAATAEPAAFSVQPDRDEGLHVQGGDGQPAGVAQRAAISHHEPGEEEPDPSEVRRQIAAARRNLDPDHQIRAAMDAFLSPSRPSGDEGSRKGH